MKARTASKTEEFNEMVETRIVALWIENSDTKTLKVLKPIEQFSTCDRYFMYFFAEAKKQDDDYSNKYRTLKLNAP